ncbi:hypothetical protein OEA41_003097 [Lepraria neglecta]|uniref:Uncharacterized protein n=1 Tax=Lepraria neglecta TaxID=209136 RepID=A0AAE0DL70_9LECA|nr:hypothetical protein OEA41_003097 [Lepraria neglecta]
MAPEPLRGKRLSEIKLFRGYNITARAVVAPIAAFTMAGLLFVYTRSSIHAAKRNVERHRAADGGQISWYNESQRRHGALEKPEEQDTIKQLFTGAKDKTGEVVVTGARRTEAEELLRARKGKRGESAGLAGHQTPLRSGRCQPGAASTRGFQPNRRNNGEKSLERRDGRLEEMKTGLWVAVDTRTR